MSCSQALCIPCPAPAQRELEFKLAAEPRSRRCAFWAFKVNLSAGPAGLRAGTSSSCVRRQAEILRCLSCSSQVTVKSERQGGQLKSDCGFGKRLSSLIEVSSLRDSSIPGKVLGLPGGHRPSPAPQNLPLLKGHFLKDSCMIRL